MTETGFDPYRDEVLDEPFRWYAWLRGQARAYLVEPGGFYAVSRYEDVVTVTREHATFSSTGGVGVQWASHPMMSMYDPPEHSRLRRIVASAFTPKAIAILRQAMVDETQRRLDALLDAGPFDFVTEFAEPLVATIMADVISLPRELVPHFRRWSLAITGTLAGNLDPAAGEQDRRALVRALRDAQRRSEGLLRVLSDASAAERLTEHELTAFCVLLLVAGFETTVNGMANGAATLLQHPAAFAALQRSPEGIARTIEEALRFDPPVHAFFRNTLRPWTFPDGSVIPEGKKVMVLFASANHDEERFPQAGTFDPSRPNVDHVAFGHGVHYCIGAPLARSLYDVVLRAFAACPRRLEARGEAQRTRNSMLRVFRSMPVELVAAAAGG
jgi:cytochrome P450